MLNLFFFFFTEIFKIKEHSFIFIGIQNLIGAFIQTCIITCFQLAISVSGMSLIFNK